jgi:hypothetical protein
MSDMQMDDDAFGIGAPPAAPTRVTFDSNGDVASPAPNGAAASPPPPPPQTSVSSRTTTELEKEVTKWKRKVTKLKMKLDQYKKLGVVVPKGALQERPLLLANFQCLAPAHRATVESVVMNAELAPVFRPGNDAHKASVAMQSLPSGTVQYYQSFCIDRYGVRNLPLDVASPAQWEAFPVPAAPRPVGSRLFFQRARVVV